MGEVSFEVQRPPLALVGAAAVLLVVAAVTAVVALPTGPVPPAVLGYLAAAGALFVGAFAKRADTRRRLSPEYSPIGWFPPAVVATSILGVVLLLLNAWPIATELAR